MYIWFVFKTNYQDFKRVSHLTSMLLLNKKIITIMTLCLVVVMYAKKLWEDGDFGFSKGVVKGKGRGL